LLGAHRARPPPRMLIAKAYLIPLAGDPVCWEASLIISRKIRSASGAPQSRSFHWPPAPAGMSAGGGGSQVGLFVIVLCYVLHEMKAVLAVLVSLILHPVNMLFHRMRLPRMLCSVLTVVGLMATISFARIRRYCRAPNGCAPWVRRGCLAGCRRFFAR
jgi:hypothetical protein